MTHADWPIGRDLQSGFDLARLLPPVFIRGIEVTQGIQWFEASRHLTDPADRGPDNGITLVAGKPAWVRVYLGAWTAPVGGVAGSVTLHRGTILSGGPHSIAVPQAWPPTVTAEPDPDYATERGTESATLNFVIPAAEVHGSLRLEVRIDAPAPVSAGQSRSFQLDARLHQTLRVRGIPIRYWGLDAGGTAVRLGPTTLADFHSTAPYTLNTYPVSATPDISLAGIFTWSESLDGTPKPGACTTGWNDVLFWLGVAKTLDGNLPGRLYLGLLPTGVPVGGNTGCGASGGASACFTGDTIAMAHELGHQLGYDHAPCGAVGPADPNYPAYEPYDTAKARMASIGEYGLDVSDGTIYPPATARDYMSYCAPQWTSLYHYRQQLGDAHFDPEYVADPDDRIPRWLEDLIAYRRYDIRHDLPQPPPDDPRRLKVHDLDPVATPSVVVTGLLDGQELDIRTVLRLDVHADDGRVVRGMRAQLLDEDGRAIAEGPLRESSPAAMCGCGGRCGDEPGTRLVQAVLPDVGTGAALRVLRDDTEVWRRLRPSTAPEVGELSVDTSEEGLVVSGRVVTAGETEPLSALRWSGDEGRTWQVLDPRVADGRTVVPFDVLPAGEVMLQLVVSDGFHTVISEPARAEVPRRPPTAAVLWPRAGSVVDAGWPMRLWGRAVGCTGESVDEEAVTWLIDGQEVGTGSDIWVPAPAEVDLHRVTLRVRSDDGDAEASVELRVGDPRR